MGTTSAKTVTSSYNGGYVLQKGPYAYVLHTEYPTYASRIMGIADCLQLQKDGRLLLLIRGPSQP